MKRKSFHQILKEFLQDDPINAVFVHDALNRHAKYIMSLKEDKDDRSLFALSLVQDIARDWQELEREPIKGKNLCFKNEAQ